MTTTASAIENTVATGLDTTELATITPVYAAVRAHRPLKGRMGGRSALFGSTIFAGAFGLFAAEAIAQQFNLPGSGGFTDVSSSINVVTDAGAGNIRVILSDGVSFLAQPGQYSLNPLTNQLQVSTDVLLGAYTGGAPVQAAQTTQVITATQAFTPPPVYAANAPLTLPQPTISGPQFTAPVAQQTYQPQVFTAGQYATQPSIVGGYQMQPSGANIAYNPPQVANLNPQPTQYVPAYSAGAQFAQAQPVSTFGSPTQPVSTFGSPTASTFGTAGTFGGDTFGGVQPIPVTQVVPTEEVAIAPVAAAAAGGLFGLPTWAVVGGGVAAAGAGVLALSSLGGGGSTTTPANNTPNANLSVSQQAFLSDPAVQAALGNTNAGSQVTDGSGSSDSGSSDSGSSDSGSSGSSGGGITVSGGSSGGSSGGTSTGSTSTSGASATISAGSEDQDITGTSGDDTVTFEAAEDAEEFNSLDLSGGDDLVILEDMDDDLTPEDMNNVENVEVQVDTAGKTLDMSNAGDDIEKLTVDANSKTITIKNVDSIDTVAVTDAGSNLVTIEDVDSGNTVALTESDNAKITSGSVLTLTVNEVNTAVEIEGVSDLTINAADGSDNSFELTASILKNLTLEGSGALTISNDLGDSDFPKIETIDGSGASGPLNLAVTGADVEDVDTGSAGDKLQINSSKSSATFDTNGGNDNIEIDGLATSVTVNAGAGGDTIELNTLLTNSNQKIDGGDGTDTLEAGASITSGDFDNIEKVEVAGAGTVNFALFDNNLSEIEVDTTANTILQNVRSSVIVETVANANVDLTSGTGTSASFEAAGNLDYDGDGSGVTAIDVDFGSAGNSTLTLSGAASPTKSITLSAAGGTVAITGAGIETAGALTSVDASALSTAVTLGAAGAGLGANEIKSFVSGSGDDTAYVDGFTSVATFDMGAGADDLIAATSIGAGTVNIDMGEGADDVTLSTAVGTVEKYQVNDLADLVSHSAAAYDTVQNFTTAEDFIDLSALSLGSKDQKTTADHADLAAAVTALLVSSDDVWLYNSTDAGVGTGDWDYILVDQGTTVGVIDVQTGNTIALGDIFL